jgi:hypothetical protein
MKLVLLLLAVTLPIRAGDVEAAVKHFYDDLDALSIRGRLDGDDVERCREVLTANYKESFVGARKELQGWRDAAKSDPERFGNLKLPFTEGAIFTWVYESGEFTRIESVTEAGDRAYAKVRIRLRPADGQDDWADLVILHRVSGRWLIDDILSDVDDDSPTSMRHYLVIPTDNQAEQAGTDQPANRPQPKSEGGDKPQPEAEGRSR